MARKTPLDRAIDALGSMSALAAAVGTSRQNISGMRKRGGQLTPQYVIRVEQATGIPRHELRPDLYPRDR